ncbi:MAG TPA: dTDP-glucose 4,6-dehydratase [Terriglobales bacterium]|nr:dTDP-glucose 4,6-dehydratase [Terriglobales bacterium]
MTHALVTGGAGFIGSNFVRHWLANDPKVRIVDLDALTYAGSLSNLEDLPDAGRHIFIQGDICDGELVLRLLYEYEVDTIVHLAAESHVDNSIAGPAGFIQTNVVGTFTLLEAARRVWLEEKRWDASRCRFHHVSTDEVFGSLTETAEPFNETSRYVPNSPYSATKAGSDHLARAYHHTYGLPVTISSCSNNYGPRQHDEKFIPTVIRSCMALKPIPIYGDGRNMRDWLHVEDNCSGLLAVLQRGTPGETYNIGCGNEWRNIEIARLICATFDSLFPSRAAHQRLLAFVPDRPGHDWRYAIDSTKIRSELAWAPRHTFEEGIRETVDWYVRARPEWMAAKSSS